MLSVILVFDWLIIFSWFGKIGFHDWNILNLQCKTNATKSSQYEEAAVQYEEILRFQLHKFYLFVMLVMLSLAKNVFLTC